MEHNRGPRRWLSAATSSDQSRPVRSETSSSSAFSLRSIASRLQNPRERAESPDGPKGPFGLRTLSQPDDQSATVHIVFVHGLGGGSHSTWSTGSVFWPSDFLPDELDFQSAAIHSFGYDSDFKRSSTLDIHGFSNSLLSAMQDSPAMRDLDVSAAVILLTGIICRNAMLLGYIYI